MYNYKDQISFAPNFRFLQNTTNKEFWSYSRLYFWIEKGFKRWSHLLNAKQSKCHLHLWVFHSIQNLQPTNLSFQKLLGSRFPSSWCWHMITLPSRHCGLGGRCIPPCGSGYGGSSIPSRSSNCTQQHKSQPMLAHKHHFNANFAHAFKDHHHYCTT